MQVHEVRAVLDRSESLVVRAVTLLLQLLGQEKDRVLQALQFLLRVMVGHEQLGLGNLLFPCFDHARDVLHVDKVADLFIKEDVLNPDLHVLRLLVATCISVRVPSLVELPLTPLVRLR